MENSSKPKISKAEAVANMARSRDDPAFFIKEIIGAEKVYDYQEEVAMAIADPGTNRVAWHTAHGVGKTCCVSWLLIWFLFTRANSKVVTTASVNRQVRDILWPEVHRWMSKTKHNLYKIGWKPNWPYNLLDMKLEIAQDWFAIGASSDTPENMEGFHADHILYIVDEAKTVDRGIFEAISGALTGNIEAKLLVVSTPPLAKEGHFYEICSGHVPGFKVFHTSAYDSPNVSRDWIKQQAEEWGEESPTFISKVKGEFPDSSQNTLIPVSWVEKANQRWKDMERPQNALVNIGVDVARYGDDETVLATALDNYVLPLEVHVKQDTMPTSGNIIRAIESRNAAKVSIDTIGLGAGVYDRVREVVRERNMPCVLRPVNVAVRAPSLVIRGERYRFKRLRDYMYWNLRERLDPINCPAEDLLALPSDHKLKTQLTSIQYTINSNGEIEIESKDELKKRGYNSPDRAEAVMMAAGKGYEGWAAILK